MKLTDYLNEQTVEVQSPLSDSGRVIGRLVELITAPGRFMDPVTLYNEVMTREKLGSTGIGESVAIPHVHLKEVDALHVAMLTSKSGVDFGAIDDKPCRIFIMVAAPDEDREGYLKVLSEVSRLMRRESVRNAVLAAAKPAQLIATLEES